MHSNIRGIDSKAKSLGTILNVIQPSVFTVNETFLDNNRKLKLQGFSSFTLKRKNESGGGVATCINVHDRMHTLKVYEGNNGHEILITRHSQFIVPINVINVMVLLKAEIQMVS